jgi:hypothetical protein
VGDFEQNCRWVFSGGVKSCKDVALSFLKNAKKFFYLILNLFEFD